MHMIRMAITMMHTMILFSYILVNHPFDDSGSTSVAPTVSAVPIDAGESGSRYRGLTSIASVISEYTTQ